MWALGTAVQKAISTVEPSLVARAEAMFGVLAALGGEDKATVMEGIDEADIFDVLEDVSLDVPSGKHRKEDESEEDEEEEEEEGDDDESDEDDDDDDDDDEDEDEDDEGDN